MDTRIDLFPMLGLERGDAHIIRNAGGLVPDHAIRSLVEATLRDGLARLRSSPELTARDHVRGFVFNPETGTLRELS